MDNVFDNTNEFRELKSPYATAAKWGAIGALAGIILHMVFHFVGSFDGDALLAGESSTLASVVSFFLGLGVMVFVTYSAIKEHRDSDLDGTISFGRALGVGALVGLVTGLISMIFMYVYYAYINPDFLVAVTDMVAIQMEEGGAGEEQVEQTMSMLGMFYTPGVFSLFSLLGSVFFYSLIGLVIGLIVKR